MVGVFDPKTEAQRGRKLARSVVSVGALLLVVGGVGLAGNSLLKSFGKSEPNTAETISANAGSLTDTLAPVEAPVMLTSFEELEPIPTRIELTETLQSRETLTDLMDRMGVSRSEANSALYSLYDSEYIDPRKVRPGLKLTAYVEPTPSFEDPEAVTLVGLTIKHDRNSSLVVSKGFDGSFSASELHTRVEPVTRRVKGEVATSLYQAALEAGAHDAQVYDYAQIFAYDVDFQREMRIGDRFEIIFEEYVDERGEFVRSGDILFASMNGHATSRDFYR